MPMEFVDQPPRAARATGASANERRTRLQALAAELKSHAKAGNDPEHPALVCSKWAILDRKVRSPEKWFDLRQMEVEVRVVNDGTATSMRDQSLQVVVSTIYGRYVKGYVWQPKNKKS